jgi:hypothetical protein
MNILRDCWPVEMGFLLWSYYLVSCWTVPCMYFTKTVPTWDLRFSRCGSEFIYVSWDVTPCNLEMERRFMSIMMTCNYLECWWSQFKVSDSTLLAVACTYVPFTAAFTHQFSSADSVGDQQWFRRCLAHYPHDWSYVALTRIEAGCSCSISGPPKRSLAPKNSSHASTSNDVINSWRHWSSPSYTVTVGVREVIRPSWHDRLHVSGALVVRLIMEEGMKKITLHRRLIIPGFDSRPFVCTIVWATHLRGY